MIWTGIEAVAVIFLMIGAGIFMSYKKWVTPSVIDFFPKIIINVAMPCMVVYFFSNEEYISRQILAGSWLPVALVFVVLPLTFFLGKLVAVVFRISKTRRGLFAALFPFSNSIFIGVPVANALFGQQGITFAIFYYLANTTYFWTLGFYSIRKDAEVISGAGKAGFAESVKKLVSPPIIAIAVMFILVFAGVELPRFITTTAMYMNGLITPLSLIFMGCMIYGYKRECASFEKDLVPVLLGRFLLAPGLLFAACLLASHFLPGYVGDPVMMRNVFTVQAGLPAMTQMSIVATRYGADEGYATKSFFWTTLLSLFTIPAYMALFEALR